MATNRVYLWVVSRVETSHCIYTHDTAYHVSSSLSSECKSFVLKLWKFLHTSSLQKQHTILDSVIEELVPLPSSEVSFLEEGSEDVGGVVAEPDSFADKIQVCHGRE